MSDMACRFVLALVAGILAATLGTVWFLVYQSVGVSVSVPRLEKRLEALEKQVQELSAPKR